MCVCIQRLAGANRLPRQAVLNKPGLAQAAALVRILPRPPSPVWWQNVTTVMCTGVANVTTF